MKTIYFNRHAKSDWSNNELNDFDRPLNERGLRDAPKMGKRLKARREDIDLFVSSPANRAISTARLMAKAYDFPPEKIVEKDRLYLPSVMDFLNSVSEMDNSLRSIILFAHNPGITDVVEYLSNESLGNIPTCGIAKIEFPSAETWEEISRGNGTLVFFDYPKKDFE
ncbi:MAG TPA: histidine phosphatase family protein [Cryomorphaceae bacterium]|nr:histidine phosphatase family protein [Cryomorphaceae bacterium]